LLESDLPYVQCVIHETLRIRPALPFAVPHSTSKDDIYKGWLIPQDTIIILNMFAIHHDPNRFPNPSEFIPERHMDYVLDVQKRKIFSQSVEDRPHLTFSTGRRVCVGINLAERNLYMAASMLLASFKIERVSNELIDVDTPKDVRAPIWAPTDYNIRLVPRHDKVKAFI
jgi:cytochrome P450